MQVGSMLKEFKAPIAKLYAKHSHIPEQTKLLADLDPRVRHPARSGHRVGYGVAGMVVMSPRASSCT